MIDTHCHLGPFAGIYLPEASLKAMVEGMGRYGLESILVAPHSALFSLTFLSLGAMMFSFAALNALPDGPSRTRMAARVVGVALAVAALVAEALA